MKEPIINRHFIIQLYIRNVFRSSKYSFKAIPLLMITSNCYCFILNKNHNLKYELHVAFKVFRIKVKQTEDFIPLLFRFSKNKFSDQTFHNSTIERFFFVPSAVDIELNIYCKSCSMYSFIIMRLHWLAKTWIYLTP